MSEISRQISGEELLGILSFLATNVKISEDGIALSRNSTKRMEYIKSHPNYIFSLSRKIKI